MGNTESEHLKEAITKNAIVTAIALVFFGLTTFIYNVLIGRVYGANTLGLANTAISTFFFIGIFVAFFSTASNKITAEYLGRGETESANYLITFSIISTAIIGVAVFFLLFILKNSFMTSFNLVDAVFLQLLFLIPLRGFFDVFRSIYYGTHRVNQYLKIIIVSSIIFMIVLIPFYFLLLPLLLPFIVMYSVFVVASVYLFKGNFNFKAAKEIKGRVQKYSLSYASIAIIGILSAIGKDNLSIMLSAMFLNTTQVGYYSAAYSFMMPLNFLPVMLSYALFPVMSYEFGKNNIEGIKRALNRIMRVWTVTLGIIVGLGIIYSKLFLELFFGSEYLPAALPFVILIVGFYFSSIIIPLISALSGTKYVHISSLTGVLGFVASTIAFIFLIPNYGIVGTSLGIAIGSFIMFIIPFYFTRRFFGFELRNFFYPFVKLLIPIIIVLFLFSNNQILLYTIGGALFFIFYLLANKEDVIYLYKEAKNQLKARI